ncbi:MAG: hypothetical protein C4B59_06990 [Candidatus Methanogaster sp.]|uniref:Uncharacterized protein n=1 Tax=Candidatus Methanogaster sp. TaxID=3386292 RepID=A0AC61L3Q3_9EURY|nr:MAG: hypothetical protein C4B59_06990 [ANME-2 cluster archaeon]
MGRKRPVRQYQQFAGICRSFRVAVPVPHAPGIDDAALMLHEQLRVEDRWRPDSRIQHQSADPCGAVPVRYFEVSGHLNTPLA